MSEIGNNPVRSFRERWLQFNLRVVFLAILLFACGPGYWIAVQQRESSEARATVKWIEANGGQVRLWTPDEPRSTWMKAIAGDDRNKYVRVVVLSGTNTTDADLERLTKLVGLYELSLSRTKISDRGLERLAKLTELRTLILSETAITDAGLSHLAQLSLLTELHLDGTRVNGTGLRQIGRLNQLEFINLSDTPIDDDALKHLHSLDKLQVIFAFKTRVTYVGADWQEAAMPQCFLFRQKSERSR